MIQCSFWHAFSTRVLPCVSVALFVVYTPLCGGTLLIQSSASPFQFIVVCFCLYSTYCASMFFWSSLRVAYLCCVHLQYRWCWLWVPLIFSPISSSSSCSYSSLHCSPHPPYSSYSLSTFLHILLLPPYHSLLLLFVTCVFLFHSLFFLPPLTKPQATCIKSSQVPSSRKSEKSCETCISSQIFYCGLPVPTCTNPL